MIIKKIDDLISSKPYLSMGSLGNCGVISSYVKGDIEEYIDEVNTVYKVQGYVMDKQGQKSKHYFLYIPPEEYGGNDYIIVDTTIDQFTDENKNTNKFINSSFGSLTEFKHRKRESPRCQASRLPASTTELSDTASQEVPVSTGVYSANP